MDSSITFAPAGWIVPQALRVLRKGGTLAINAIHMSPIPEMDYSFIYGERTVRSVANLTRQDAEELLQLAAEIPIRTDVELHALEEANRVLQRLKRAEVRGAAVLTMPWRERFTGNRRCLPVVARCARMRSQLSTSRKARKVCHPSRDLKQEQRSWPKEL